MVIKMDFVLKHGETYSIHINHGESEAVKIAVGNLKTDLWKTMEAVEAADRGRVKIFIGTLGVSEEFDSMIDREKMLDENGILRKEAYLHCIKDGSLVIAGSDRRGTIYGIYELCEQLGVSPFYFWADVPVKVRDELFFTADYEKADFPSIAYRGIFINDEEELEAWVRNDMGEETIGVRTYEKVFELLLRLKGNYIWPAMHVNSFNMVPENGALAERMGIVVGTSHCDMLMRSNNREWKPWIEKKGYQDAVYDYSIPGKNREILKEYWRESVEQNREFEVCYTLGTRDIHDSGFETSTLQGQTAEEKRKAKVELLSMVIRDQQEILKETLGHDAMMTFIPYKEVLELYDSGLEVPEELTLVWANDNYGYIRRYPSEKEKNRKGGNGIYYHNSYWAPPSMSYVFLCSIPLSHTRNELRKAYQEGIRKLWVLNVGAMKPLEMEIGFFLRLAWEIGKENVPSSDVDGYVEDWLNRTFSGDIGKDCAKLLNDLSQLTNVRKLENMDNDVFSQTAYGDEAAVRIHEYERLFEKGNSIYEMLPEKERDAFFQLVLFRIHVAYFTNLQFYYGDRSTLMYDRGQMQAADFYTKKSREFDDARRKLIWYYNRVMAGGKWNGIVNPEGFPPPRAAMLPVCTPALETGKRSMVVHIWNEGDKLTFVRPETKWIEIGNGGAGQFAFVIEAPDWVELSDRQGEVRTEERILIGIQDVSEDRQGTLKVRNLTDDVEKIIEIEVLAVDTDCPNIEDDGVVTVEAASVPLEGTGFGLVKRLGRGTGDLVEALREEEREKEETPLTYHFYLLTGGDCLLEVHRFPSLDSTGRIRIGVSVDEGEKQVMESDASDEWRGNWKKNVLDNVDRLYMRLPDLRPGSHTITFYPIDRYFAFSRFVIYTKERKANNYIGIGGNQSLPKVWDAEKRLEDFYGNITLAPRPVFYACPDRETDDLGLTDTICYEEHYGKTTEPAAYLRQGKEILIEEAGAVRIDAACVLAQSEFHYTSGEGWRHCASESYARSGLAMYVRRPEMKWCQEEAPALHYRIRCGGGTYTLWLLAKFNVGEKAGFGAALDGKFWDRDALYRKGSLWRYESEQIYRWVPLFKAEIEEGIHELLLCPLAPGLRFDRIYLTRGKELPPIDSGWKNNFNYGI